MLAALAALVLGAATCLGLGLGVLGMATARLPGRLGVGDVGLLGLAALALLGMAVNLVAALAPWAAAAALLAGLALLVARRHALAACSAGWGGSAPRALLVLGAFVLAMLPLMLRSAGWHFDTGLYHLPHIRQAMEFPVILGAANLHERFGYNSAWFPAAAMLGLDGPRLAGAFVVNALLAGFLLLALAERVPAQLREGRAAAALFGILLALLAYATPALSLRGWLGSPNTDLPACLLTLYAFHLALHFAEDGPDRPATAGLLALLLGLAVAVKLSALPLLLLLLLPLLGWRRGWLTGGHMLAVLAAPALLGLAWLLRGVAMSGCLAYPEAASCLALPWRVPEAVARGDAAWIRAWARLPGVPPDRFPAGFGWVGPWFGTLRADPAWPWLLGMLALGLAAAAARLATRSRATLRAADAAVLAGAALAALAFWFLTAPLLRYGKTFLFLPPMLACALLAPPALAGRLGALVPGPRRQGWLLAGLLAVLLLHTVLRPARLLWEQPLTFPVLPEVATRGVAELDGLAVSLPLGGEQCWNAPAVCTPRLHREVLLSRHGPWWMVRAAESGSAP